MKARLAAVRALRAGQVTDEALLQARDAHLFAYADYAARQPFLAAFVSTSLPQLYAPVTAETALHECCGHLLSAIGLELTYPAEAGRFKSAGAFLRRRDAATWGFVAPADPAP